MPKKKAPYDGTDVFHLSALGVLLLSMRLWTLFCCSARLPQRELLAGCELLGVEVDGLRNDASASYDVNVMMRAQVMARLQVNVRIRLRRHVGIDKSRRLYFM